MQTCNNAMLTVLDENFIIIYAKRESTSDKLK